MVREDIEKILIQLQGIMRLQNWDIHIDKDYTNKDTNYHARVACSDDYMSATIELDRDHKDWDEWKTRRYIAHELMHVAMRDVDTVVSRFIPITALHTDVDSILKEVYDHSSEGFVDQMARCFADLTNGMEY